MVNRMQESFTYSLHTTAYVWSLSGQLISAARYSFSPPEHSNTDISKVKKMVMKTRRVSSLRAKYKQTGGNLALALALTKCKCHCQPTLAVKRKQKKKTLPKKLPTVQKEFQIMKGSVTDVKFIGHTRTGRG